jgi:hypothetical protein
MLLSSTGRACHYQVASTLEVDVAFSKPNLLCVVCRNYLAEDEDAPFDGSLLSADKRCFSAFQARYGRNLSRALYTRLLLSGGQQQEEDEGARDE